MLFFRNNTLNLSEIYRSSPPHRMNVPGWGIFFIKRDGPESICVPYQQRYSYFGQLGDPAFLTVVNKDKPEAKNHPYFKYSGPLTVHDGERYTKLFSLFHYIFNFINRMYDHERNRAVEE